MTLLLNVILPLVNALIANAPELAQSIGVFMVKQTPLTDEDIAKLKEFAKPYDEV